MKINKIKSVVSILVILAMIISLLPSAAHATAQVLYNPAAPPPGYLNFAGSNDSGKEYMLYGGVATDILSGTSPGKDYCNYFNTSGQNSMGNQNGYDQFFYTGFTPEQQFINWQQGSSNLHSICQTELGTWGFEILSPDNGNCTVPLHSCGMHHFARLNAPYSPWNSGGTAPHPTLTFSVKPQPHYISSNPTGVWGYTCPILKDTTSNKYIEYCFDNWVKGSGFPNVSHNDQIGDCGDFPNPNPAYSIATIITDFSPSSTWATERTGSADSQKQSINLGSTVTQTASITAKNLANAIVQIKKPADPDPLRRSKDGPYGCAYTDMSSNPADYQVIGFESGMEGGGYTALGANVADEHMWITTDTLYSEDVLNSGQTIYSSGYASNSTGHKLVMQPDGNLCEYDSFGTWDNWCSGTYGYFGAHAVMQLDGNFVIYDSSGSPRWSTGSSNPGSYLIVQDDGNIVIYKGNVFQWHK